MRRRRRRASRLERIYVTIMTALTGAALAVVMLCLPGAAAAQSTARQNPPTSGADTVRVGCSGGSNGGSSGWLLMTSGQMRRFAGRSALTHVDAGRDSLAVARVFAALDRIGLRSRTGSASRPIPDAIVCSVRISSVAGRGGIHWLYQRTPPEIEPALAAIDSAVGRGESGAWLNHWQRTGDVWP